MIVNIDEKELKSLSFLDKNLKRIEQAILETLPPKELSKIAEAIHYSVLNGGKG